MHVTEQPDQTILDAHSFDFARISHTAAAPTCWMILQDHEALSLADPRQIKSGFMGRVLLASDPTSKSAGGDPGPGLHIFQATFEPQMVDSSSSSMNAMVNYHYCNRSATPAHPPAQKRLAAYRLVHALRIGTHMP